MQILSHSSVVSVLLCFIILMVSCSNTYAPGNARVSQEPTASYQSDGDEREGAQDAGGGHGDDDSRDAPEPLDVTDDSTGPLDVADDSTEPLDVADDSTEPLDIADDSTEPLDVADDTTAQHDVAVDTAELDAAEEELFGEDVVSSDTHDLFDTASVDTGDTQEIEHHVTLAIVTPEEGVVIGTGVQTQFTGQVLESSLPVEELRLEWSSDRDGALHSGVARPDGTTQADPIQLTTPGVHTVYLRAYQGALRVAETSIVVQVCAWEVDARFVGQPDVESGEWGLWSDASLTSEDTAQLTDLGRAQRGGLVFTERPIEMHYTSIGFRFWIGGGRGADGLALNVIDVDNLDVLRTLILVSGGGSLGYAYDAPFAGLHVEVDTYRNGRLGDQDIQRQHIAIALDGDPTNRIAAANVERLTDQQWHQFVFYIDPNGHALVYVDNVKRLETQIAMEGLLSRGYLSISAATGWADNIHRVDDVEIRQCRLPEP